MKSAISLLVALTFISFSGISFASSAGDFYSALKAGTTIEGFNVTNQYIDDNQNGIGGRFISEKYGFIIDLFTLESAPQAFYWIKTPPGSDRGEPHTCEHLLLGKGNVGRNVAAQEEMLLGSSTAYTDQLVTCYHFNTVAGNEAFFTLFESKLNAFLNPDFSDEEIRREVSHIGITEQPDGSLWIDEKGTVYTEMVSNYEKPWSYLWEPMDETIFGPNHPCANISGGRPDAIRQMIPQNLRDFHKETHVLSNMGAIVAIPPSIAPSECLKRLAVILRNCQAFPSPNTKPSMTVTNLPPPAPVAPAGTMTINAAPAVSLDEPGEFLFSWPAQLELSPEEEVYLEIFLNGLANGASSTLYKILFDSGTRNIDIGSGYCHASLSSYPGHPVRINIGNVDADRVTPEVIDSVRALIVRSIREISEFQPESAELAEFNDRARASLIQRQRGYGKILDTPPQFGFRRGPAGFWLSHLETLERIPGFSKSITMSDIFKRVENGLNEDSNIWRKYIERWRLLDSPPYVMAIHPDTSLISKINIAKEERLEKFVAELKSLYHVDSEQAALKRYRQQFDSTTAILDHQASQVAHFKFTDNPPLSLDPELNYILSRIDNIRVDACEFSHLNSATIGIAFNVNALPDSLMLYIPALPAIMLSVGMEHHGAKLTYREVETRLRREILGLSCYYSNSDATGRSELVVKGSGATLDESLVALEWMNSTLFQPLITGDNLPRIRDVVSQQLNGARNRMKESEEDWVDTPFNALRHQNNKRYLAADCFLTQVNYLQRLKWRLSSPADPFERATLLKFTRNLLDEGRGKSRSEIDAIISRTVIDIKPESVRQTAESFLSDLRVLIASLPDESLQLDWEYLLGSAITDFGYGSHYALLDLKASLRQITQKHSARIFLISNSENRPSIERKLKEIVDKLGMPSMPVIEKTTPVVLQAVKARGGRSDAVYLGLVNEATSNGLIYFSSKIHEPYDPSPKAVVNSLAGRLYSGGGAHGLFMQTWAAGLAYSNGIAYRDRWGAVRYYAERCPDAAETMKFVVSIIESAEENPALFDYVVALAFGESNAAATYEERGESFANDLADGFSPEKIAEFRRAVLRIRKNSKMFKDIWKQMEAVYGQVLTGYGAPKLSGKGNTFLIIGPDEQIISMERLITTEEGSQHPVTRIYPRDFWIR